MCAPAVVGGILGLAAAAKAVGDWQSSTVEEKVARNNAQVLEWERSAALRQGAQEASAIQAEGRQVQGSALAGLAAGNVDTSSGAGANIIATSGVNAAMDAATAKANAIREAWGLGNQRRDLLAQARLLRRSRGLQAVGTGLGFGAQLGSLFLPKPGAEK